MPKSYLALFILPLIFFRGFGQDIRISDLKSRQVSVEDLLQWDMYGEGDVSRFRTQVALQEADGSKGVMLISPGQYSSNVVIRYKAFALTPATVIVTMLSISDEGTSPELTLTQDYDGSITPWLKEKESYFFAFKNASHDRQPLLRKNPGASGAMAEAKENVMIAGKYYEVEVGKLNSKLWLSVDGEKLFEVKDDQPHGEGKVALRIRGTAGFKAGCLFKELEILSE